VVIGVDLTDLCWGERGEGSGYCSRLMGQLHSVDSGRAGGKRTTTTTTRKVRGFFGRRKKRFRREKGEGKKRKNKNEEGEKI
jgi:hypothetical protein